MSCVREKRQICWTILCDCRFSSTHQKALDPRCFRSIPEEFAGPHTLAWFPPFVTEDLHHQDVNVHRCSSLPHQYVMACPEEISGPKLLMSNSRHHIGACACVDCVITNAALLSCSAVFEHAHCKYFLQQLLHVASRASMSSNVAYTTRNLNHMFHGIGPTE